MRARRSPRLLLTTDAVGGVWTYSLDLARGLAAAGVEVVLATLGPAPDGAQRAAAEQIPGLALAETDLPLDWTAERPGQLSDAGAALRDLAAEARVDLVHLNSPALAGDGHWPAPVLGACHSCLATWWAAVKTGPMPADFAWRTEALRQGLAACDRLVAPTAAFARATHAAHGGLAPAVVWNGRAAPATSQAGGGLEGVVFTTGRLWDEGKNVATLDAAAERLTTPLFAAGPRSGPTGNAVELSQAVALGALTQSDVRAWLARRPVFATAALYEPFGLGVLEAAQAGCPLVLSDIATLRELWTDAAVFVDPRDPIAYAGELAALLADPDCRRALGDAARIRAGRYTDARMTAGVLALYGELADAFADLPVAEAVA